MIRVVRKFLLLLDRRQKKRLVILLFMMIMGAFLESLGVSMMVPLISVVMDKSAMENNAFVVFLCDFFHVFSYKSFVMLGISILVVVFIFKDLFLIVQYYAQYRFVYNNCFLTQSKIMDALLNRPYTFFLNAESGEIMRIVQADVDNTFNLLISLVLLCSDSVVSIALIITVFVVSPFMTMMVALMMGISVLVIIIIIRPMMKKQGQIYAKSLALTNKWMMQTINGIKEIKITQKESFFRNNFERSGVKRVHSQKVNGVVSVIPKLLVEMTSVCSILVILAILIYNGKPIESLMPALSAFAMAAVKLLPSANRIVSTVGTVAYFEPALDKLLENISLLDEEKPDKIENDTEEFSVNREITLSDVDYCYQGRPENVLSNVSITIPMGKSIGIVGTSGAGKSTLVDIILGLLEPASGMVAVDGKNIKDSHKQWWSHIGYIPQSIFLLDGSIKDNVAFGVDKDMISEENVWKALKEAQLDDFVKTLPMGINTEVGERGLRVSGGQKQRIGIARALYLNPDILVFDEATSALDNETEASIMESINSFHGKKTLIIIAHRLSTIEECDIVYRVDKGNVSREK